MGIYLDNAATTPVDPQVAAAMSACLGDDFGNPSSQHAPGRLAHERVEHARAELSSALGDPDGKFGRIIFTSGGTEADALALHGMAAHAGARRHVVLTQSEHAAVRGACTRLEEDGFRVTCACPDESGRLSAESILTHVADDTGVVACMLVQNEIGTVYPIADIVRAVRERAPHARVHCDAIQGFGKIPVNVVALGVDTLAVSGHKLHGPKGIGALWVKHGTPLRALWGGGGQELGLRSGTENVPGIVGLGTAAHLAAHHLEDELARLTALHTQFETALLAARLGIVIHGAGAPRVPHIVSIGVPGLSSEALVAALSARGIYVSAGSACASHSKKPSGLLNLLGSTRAMATVRFSMGRRTVLADLVSAVDALTAAVRALREAA